LEENLGPVDRAGVEQIVMDEFAIHKGHRYATVISDGSNKRVYGSAEGTAGGIRPFFEQFWARKEDGD